eukprot:6200561-Pyramimonas_sp.AAC.1
MIRVATAKERGVGRRGWRGEEGMGGEKKMRRLVVGEGGDGGIPFRFAKTSTAQDVAATAQ